MFFEAERLIQAGNLPLLQSGTEKEAAAYVRTSQDEEEDYSLAAAWKSVLHSSAGKCLVLKTLEFHQITV